jgi:hypothetical protein
MITFQIRINFRFKIASTHPALTAAGWIALIIQRKAGAGSSGTFASLDPPGQARFENEPEAWSIGFTVSEIIPDYKVTHG